MATRFEQDKITGFWKAALAPKDEAAEGTDIPENVSKDYTKINAQIENKYTREYLKICAYYNKMFPSLKSNSWSRSSYNTIPFTAQDQEREDTGTGIALNYLKQVIGQVVSRLGTVSFEPVLLADVPTLTYVIAKDDAERLLRKTIRNGDLNRYAIECFHDASILGFSHLLMDPVTKKWRKINDWELGCYESEFNQYHLKHALIRDFSFPKSELKPYLELCESVEKLEQIESELTDKSGVDFKMYFDCIQHTVTCIIGSKTLWQIPYEPDELQLITFSWDTGVTRVMTTSLFDLLYPVQRELNKAGAKKQQLIRLYKGPVPVFSGINDVDPVMKQISNGSGECLYLDTPKDVTTLMTVLNPTPLDPELSAAMTENKSEMFELAGVQQMSMDMENFRSASAMIAMDQIRDATFQTQMASMSRFIKEVLIMTIMNSEEDEDMKTLIKEAYIDLKPVHMNDPMGHKGTEEGAKPPDYNQIALSKYVRNVIKGNKTFEDMPFTLDDQEVRTLMAQTAVKIESMDEECDTVQLWLVSAFINDVEKGAWQL